MADKLRLGEHKGRRTKNTKTFFNFDGSFTTEIFNAPLHFECENGELHDINAALVEEADLDALELPVSKDNAEKIKKVKAKKTRDKVFHTVGTDFDAKVFKDFSRGYSIGKGKDKLTFVPVGIKESETAHEGNTVVHKGAWADTDVKLEVNDRGIKETIILNSEVAPASFSFEVKGGLEDDLTSGALRLEPAWLIDASGERRDVEQVIRTEGKDTFVDLTADVSGLTYPIEIDPTVVIQPDPTIGIDTYVSSGSVNSSYQDQTSIFFGVDSIATPPKFRAYLKFDLSSIPPNVPINTASLNLYVQNGANTTVRTYNVHRPEGTWTENLTWNTQPTFNTGDYLTFQASIHPQNYDIDVKPFVLDWVNGAKVNNGFMIKDPIESSANATWKSFPSSEYSSNPDLRPKLTVTYSIPPNPPTITKPSDGEAWNTQHTVEWAPGYGEFTVVNVAHDIAGDGRKIVELSNGWLVSASTHTDDKVYFHVSKDGGNKWDVLTTHFTNDGATTDMYVSLSSKGTRVFVLFHSRGQTSYGYRVHFYSFDALTVASTLTTGFGDKYEFSLASGGSFTGLAGNSMVINESQTELHATFSAKHNLTNPNSHNVIYAKGTINVDGSVTWTTAVQINSVNISGNDNMNPSITLDKDGKPVILYTNGRMLRVSYLVGSTWTQKDIYDGVYAQSNPSARFVPKSINGLENGRMWVLWHGANTTTSTTRYIFSSYSDDGGVTWTAATQITGDGYEYPSLTADKDNKIFAVYKGTGTGVYYKVNTAGTWGAQKTIRTDGTGSNPSTLFDLSKSYNEPLFIYKDSVSSKVGFFGYVALPAQVELSTDNGVTWKNVLASISGSAVNDATVVAQAFDTSGNGGRKMVMLSNGWLVAGVKTEDYFYFQVDKRDGAGFVPSCYMYNLAISAAGDIAIVAKGTKVYVLSTLHGASGSIQCHSFDAATISNVNIYGGVSGSTLYTLDSSQTALGNVSLTINEGGTELHAAWASKNATYPNSFNVRYAKATLDGSGVPTWGAVEQVTFANASGYEYTNPCVTLDRLGIPIIHSSMRGYKNSGTSLALDTNSYGISILKRSNELYVGASAVHASWSAKTVFDNLTYVQSSPSAIFVPQSVNGLANGRIWVAWDGFDATDSTVKNIRYSYSDDGGVTWSAMQKLTSGNTYSHAFASITTNKNNEISVVWQGRDASQSAYFNIFKIKNAVGTWGAVSKVTSNTTNHTNSPSTLFDLSVNYTEPLFIYQNTQTAKVGFYSGNWTYQPRHTAAGTTSFAYDFTNEPATNQAKLRVRAFDGVYYSSYDEVLFAIVHKLKIGSYGFGTPTGVLLIPVYDPSVGMDGKSALRFGEGSMVGCFELVPTNDAKATGLRVQTPAGTKAIAKE